MAKEITEDLFTSSTGEENDLSFNGVPFRGRIPNLSKTDMPPVMDYDVHVDILDLSDEEQKTKYEQICQKFVQGKAFIWVDDRKWDANSGNFKVFVRWADVFMRMPNKAELKKYRETMMGLLPQ